MKGKIGFTFGDWKDRVVGLVPSKKSDADDWKRYLETKKKEAESRNLSRWTREELLVIPHRPRQGSISLLRPNVSRLGFFREEEKEKAKFKPSYVLGDIFNDAWRDGKRGLWPRPKMNLDIDEKYDLGLIDYEKYRTQTVGDNYTWDENSYRLQRRSKSARFSRHYMENQDRKNWNKKRKSSGMSIRDPSINTVATLKRKGFKLLNKLIKNNNSNDTYAYDRKTIESFNCRVRIGNRYRDDGHDHGNINGLKLIFKRKFNLKKVNSKKNINITSNDKFMIKQDNITLNESKLLIGGYIRKIIANDMSIFLGKDILNLILIKYIELNGNIIAGFVSDYHYDYDNCQTKLNVPNRHIKCRVTKITTDGYVFKRHFFFT